MLSLSKRLLLPLAISAISSGAVGLDIKSNNFERLSQFSTGFKSKQISTKSFLRGVEISKEYGGHILDLRNPDHEHFIKNRLSLAGSTKNKFPQLYKNLELSKKSDGSMNGLLSKKGALSGDPLKYGLIKNAHFFIGDNVGTFEKDGKNYFFVRAKSSFYQSATATYIDLLLQDSKGNQIAPIGSALTIGNDTKDSVAISVVELSVLRKNNPDLDRVYASSFVEIEDSNGKIITGVKEVEYAFSWESIDAHYGKKTSQKSGKLSQEPQYFPVHPVDRKDDEDDYIKICLNRQHSDCDYMPDQLGDPNNKTLVRIPFKGRIHVPHEVHDIIPTGETIGGMSFSTNVYLQEGQYGGAAEIGYKPLGAVKKKFSDYLDFKVDEKLKETVISWDIPRDEGVFGNALLFSNIAEANWFIQIGVSGKPNFRGRTGFFQVGITSEGAEQLGNYYVANLEKMKLGYSCLAKGTLITMADGTQKAIESIIVGDTVKGATVDGTSPAETMTVNDVSIGIETIDMYRILTSDGQSLLMTESHPISTSNKGIIWAKELEAGDRILTEAGTSTLVKTVSTEAYSDNVYNLKLATSSKSAIPEESHLAMYANRLLVGDLKSQDYFNYKDQYDLETPEEKLSKVPEKWKVDYLNSLN